MIQYEKQLEDLIWDAYTQEGGDKKLAERGLTLQGYMLRQYKLQDGTIPDLITIDVDFFGYPFIQIIELKKDGIGFDTLEQAFGYWVKFREIIWIEFGKPKGLEKFDFFQKIRCEIILIGSSLSSNTLAFLGDSFSNPDTLIITPTLYEFDPFLGLLFQPCRYWACMESFTPVSKYLPDELLTSLKIVSNETRDRFKEDLAILKSTHSN